MDLELTGKRALITGGSRGIGLAIASRLGVEGCRIALCGRNSMDISQALRQLRDAGIDAIGRALDIADAQAYDAWIDEAAETMGGLDIFVSNASSMIVDGSEDAWRRAVEVDLLAAVRGMEKAACFLAESDAGAAVLIGSIAALDVRGSVGPYAALKAALLPLVKGWAHRYGPSVRVNCVSPGPILFPGGSWDILRLQSPDQVEAIANSMPLRRLGHPGEVADLVAFLASPRAAYITGSNFVIDGGASHAV
jgi:3-oxoacyl-[acyl-carrier protein] reductase